MSTPFCVSPPNLAHRTKKHRKTCSKHRSPPLTSLPAVTPPHLMYSSVGPDDSVRPNTRLPHPHFVLILSFRASAHTGVGIRIPRPLPLPLGEVAERSEDGEGKQRRAAFRRPFFQLVDKPSLRGQRFFYAGGARGGKARLESDQMSRKALPCKACVERSDYFRAARRHKNNGIISGCRKKPEAFFDSLKRRFPIAANPARPVHARRTPAPSGRRS